MKKHLTPFWGIGVNQKALNKIFHHLTKIRLEIEPKLNIIENLDADFNQNKLSLSCKFQIDLPNENERNFLRFGVFLARFPSLVSSFGSKFPLFDITRVKTELLEKRCYKSSTRNFPYVPISENHNM